MTPTPSQLLACAVEYYDEGPQPVTCRQVAERFETPPAAVRSCFERLVECKLLARIDGGYRPTITGREFLELDIDDEMIIVDPDGDC